MTTIIDKTSTYIKNWNSKTKNIGQIKAIYLTNNLVDLFLWDGWETMVQIKLNRKDKSFAFTDPTQRGNVLFRNKILEILPTLLGE